MAFNLENKLTNRERFRRLMSGAGPIDRVPALEWASWWDKTITHWEQNGMPSGLDTQELYDYFQLDSIAQFWFPHKTEDCPQDVSHGSGIIETFEDYERIRPYILPENAVELMREQIEQTLPRYQSGETVVWYTIEGFFWWPRVLFALKIISMPSMISRSYIIEYVKIYCNGKSKLSTTSLNTCMLIS
jgi:hypothetical protein